MLLRISTLSTFISKVIQILMTDWKIAFHEQIINDATCLSVGPLFLGKQIYHDFGIFILSLHFYHCRIWTRSNFFKTSIATEACFFICKWFPKLFHWKVRFEISINRYFLGEKYPSGWVIDASFIIAGITSEIVFNFLMLKFRELISFQSFFLMSSLRLQHQNLRHRKTLEKQKSRICSVLSHSDLVLATFVPNMSMV